MKANRLIKTVTLLAAFVFLLPGCRNYKVPEKGSVSLENARIDFQEGGVEGAEWKGKQVDINYSISQKSTGLVISGTVIIHDQVLASFGRLDQLVVKLNFLSNSGSVLETVDITPRYATFDQVEGPLDFKAVAAPVPGATSFAFSYFGTFFSESGEAGGGSFEIFYFPFD